jgi:hypothetical protein
MNSMLSGRGKIIAAFGGIVADGRFSDVHSIAGAEFRTTVHANSAANVIRMCTSAAGLASAVAYKQVYCRDAERFTTPSFRLRRRQVAAPLWTAPSRQGEKVGHTAPRCAVRRPDEVREYAG